MYNSKLLIAALALIWSCLTTAEARAQESAFPRLRLGQPFPFADGVAMSLPTYRTLRARWLLADRVIESKRVLNDSLTDLLQSERRMRQFDREDLRAAQAEAARQAAAFDHLNQTCDKAVAEAMRRPVFFLSKPFWYGVGAGAVAAFFGIATTR